MESIEKLREWARVVTNSSPDENIVSPEFVAKECGRKVLLIADAIEREIAERYMELPVDAEGVPIHLGDMVEGELLFDNATVKGTVTTYHIHDDDEPGTVYIRVKPTENTWTIKELRFTRCRHVKPRTIEDVLRDCCNEWNEHCGDDWESGVYAKYADELRSMGVGE